MTIGAWTTPSRVQRISALNDPASSISAWTVTLSVASGTRGDDVTLRIAGG